MKFFFWFPNSTVQVKQPSQERASHYKYIPTTVEVPRLCSGGPEHMGAAPDLPDQPFWQAFLSAGCNDFGILSDLFSPCKEACKMLFTNL